MRITKEEVVAGHSAMRVRGFLRRFERGFFMHTAAESLMRLNSKQAAKFINDLVALEFIEPTMPFGDEAAFQVATRGHAFSNATAAKPISRGTAERVLGEFVDRVNAVNASKEYAFIVRAPFCLAVCFHVWKGWVMLMSLLICDPESQIPPSSDSNATVAGIWRNNAEGHSPRYLNGRHGLRKKLCYC